MTMKARLLPLAFTLLTGCAAHHPRTAAPPVKAVSSQVRLEVVNRSASDMDIYLERGGQRIRLGIAPGSKTTRFSLGAAEVVGTEAARFLAVPIGGFGPAASTLPMMIQTGQVLTLDVPPM